MCRTNFGGDVRCVSPNSKGVEQVVQLAKAVIDKENLSMLVEPFACGSSLISNGLFPEYRDKITFHLTDARLETHIQGSISAKVEYESLVPWLLDKKAFIYCDPPHKDFNDIYFYTLMNLLQKQNYVIIRSIFKRPPQNYKQIFDGCYIQEDSLLDRWIKENVYVAETVYC